MLKNFIKGFVVAGIIVTVHINLPTSSAQHTADRFPESFFMGKWSGYISGAVVDTVRTPDGGYIVYTYPFEIRLGGIPSEYPISPFGGACSFNMMMKGLWPGNFTFSETAYGGIMFPPEFVVFTIGYPADCPGFIGYDAAFKIAGFTVHVEDENLISLTSGGADSQIWTTGGSYAFGELARFSVLSDTLGRTIEINEPVETDGFTQRVITVEDVGDFVVDTNSEIVFNSETDIELYMGKVCAIIHRLGPSRIQVRSPQAVCGVRGTKFVVEVQNDGTDIVIVLEGEVEFSDRENENSVIVGQNQMSTCETGVVPAEPESINPDEIFRWWE